MAKLILYQTKSPYEGDITKNCEMTGKEMDSNFLNLKGDDIKNIVLDDETNILTVTRMKDGHHDCNGDRINARFNIDLNKLGFVSDLEVVDGKLIGKKSDGKEIVIRLNDVSVLCSTDGTIDGNGSTMHPLSISRGSRTGQYAPCKYIIDTRDGEKLPEEPSLGDRYITIETISKYGKLYPYDAVWKIQKDLQRANYGWRIPTKKDWDETLMLLEGCKELPKGYKSHFLHETGNLGRYAGMQAKTVDTWNEPELNEDNAGRMNIAATGFRDAAGNWNAGSDSHGAGKSAAYWSSTLREGDRMDDDGYKVYVKRFDAYRVVNGEKIECNTVRQDVMPQTSRLSVKLVKDYDGTNFVSSEDIFGTYYPCELVDARTEDEDLNNELNELFKPKIWISVNLSYSTEKIENEIEDSPLSGDGETRFFINDWNGNSWVRQELVLGDSVVLTEEYVDESGSTEIHEYRMLPDDEGVLGLVDLDSSSQGAIGHLQEEIDEINAELDETNEKIDTITDNIGLNDDGTLPPFENELISSASTIVEAIEDIADELMNGAGSVNKVKESVGLDENGDYIPPRESGITSNSDTVVDAIGMLDDAVVELMSGGQGTQEELNDVESAVGLDENGHYIPKEGTNFLDNATSVEGEIVALDNALGETKEALEEADEKIRNGVGLAADGSHIDPNGHYTDGTSTIAEEIEKLDEEAYRHSGETDNIETAVGLDEDGKYIRKSESNYLNHARSIEEEIETLDEVLHDKDVELVNVKESVGLNVADGKIPDDAWVDTNVIDENTSTVISAIKQLDEKIGKPTDTRDDFPAGATDEEISLYAYINESDYGEF